MIVATNKLLGVFLAQIKIKVTLAYNSGYCWTLHVEVGLCEGHVVIEQEQDSGYGLKPWAVSVNGTGC